MARKKKKESNIIPKNNRTAHFILTFILMLTGIYYLGLNYVPQKWYETQTMMPNQVESYYVNQWCSPDFGRKEAILWDMTRVDCLSKDYAIEFDFAKKWAESIGQSLYYSKLTGKSEIPTTLDSLDSPRFISSILFSFFLWHKFCIVNIFI